MTKTNESPARAAWLDCLRTTLTILVVAHHSSLAYTTFARFDPERYLASTAPIVDAARWGFFDYAENFNDVFFMSLMFFVSGLLVLPGLARHGPSAYLRGRALRLGLVFLFAVGALMPLAYYPSYLQSGGTMSYLAYWLQRFPRDGLPPGPPWFIWMLLLFDAIAAVSLPVLQWFSRVRAKAFESWKDKPAKAFLAIFLVAVVAYIPMIARFGEHTWRAFFIPPLYFQTSRILLYFAWFALGALIGAKGFDQGMLSGRGALARRWPLWVAACLVAYNLLWFVPGSSWLRSLLPNGQWRGLVYVMLWLLSCCASSFAFLAAYRALANRSAAWMSSLSRSAYTIYIIHYLFVTWIQKSLLGVALPAVSKFAITFWLSLGLSWFTAFAIRALRNRTLFASPKRGIGT
jgi:glucans biosynthesis protein C